MQSFYDEVSITKKFEFGFKLNKKVPISLSRLVTIHYSAVQIVGAGAWKKLQIATFSKGCSIRNN